MSAPEALWALLGRVEAADGPDRDLDAMLSAAFRASETVDGDHDTSWHSKAIYAPMAGSVVIALKTDDPSTTRAVCRRALPLTCSPLMREVVREGLRALIAQATPAQPRAPGAAP